MSILLRKCQVCQVRKPKDMVDPDTWRCSTCMGAQVPCIGAQALNSSRRLSLNRSNKYMRTNSGSVVAMPNSALSSSLSAEPIFFRDQIQRAALTTATTTRRVFSTNTTPTTSPLAASPKTPPYTFDNHGSRIPQTKGSEEPARLLSMDQAGDQDHHRETSLVPAGRQSSPTVRKGSMARKISGWSADAGAAADDWPEEERYISSCPEAAKLAEESQFREFTLGASCFHTAGHLDESELTDGCCMASWDGSDEPMGPDQKSPNYHTKVLLLTDSVTEVTFWFGNVPEINETPVKNGEWLAGISLGKEGDELNIGHVDKRSDNSATLDLGEEFPFFKEILMQQCIWKDAESGNLLKRIAYLEIVPFGNKEPVVFGEMHETGFVDEMFWCNQESTKGTLAFTGVGLAGRRPISFQIVDLNTSADPANCLDTVFLSQGVPSAMHITDEASLSWYEHRGLVAVEDDALYTNLEELMCAIDNVTPCKSELLPNSVDLINQALASETKPLQAVFRLNRYLSHVIQTRKTAHLWTHGRTNWMKVVPLKQMVHIQALTLHTTKMLTDNQPDINVYTYALLNKEGKSSMVAVLTFICQVLLMVMLMCGINISEFGAYEGSTVIGVVMSAIVAICAKSQIDNHYATKKTFRDLECGIEMETHWLMVMDWVTNVIMAVFVVFLNFVLLCCTTEYLDLVMNATAIVFIIELDDVVMNAADDEVTDLYRTFLFSYLRNKVAAVDKRYWYPLDLPKTYPAINLQHNAFQWGV